MDQQKKSTAFVHLGRVPRDVKLFSTLTPFGYDCLEAPDKEKELWMFIDPTESEFEEPRAGNPHAGICEGVILSSDRRRG